MSWEKLRGLSLLPLSNSTTVKKYEEEIYICYFSMCFISNFDNITNQTHLKSIVLLKSLSNHTMFILNWQTSHQVTLSLSILPTVKYDCNLMTSMIHIWSVAGFIYGEPLWFRNNSSDRWKYYWCSKQIQLKNKKEQKGKKPQRINQNGNKHCLYIV